MTHAPLDLQKALFSHLNADTTLISLIGGARIYDGAPRRAELPYVTFEAAATTPLGSDGSQILEHQVSLTVISQSGGRSTGEDIADRLVDLIDEAALSPAGCHLVDLTLSSRGSERSNDGRTYRSRLQFRAVTETL